MADSRLATIAEKQASVGTLARTIESEKLKLAQAQAALADTLAQKQAVTAVSVSTVLCSDSAEPFHDDSQRLEKFVPFSTRYTEEEGRLEKTKQVRELDQFSSACFTSRAFALIYPMYWLK